MQGQSFAELVSAPSSYAGQEYVFTERNWHDCDEHQRAVRTSRYKLIRTDAYTELPLCTAADIGASPSFSRFGRWRKQAVSRRLAGLAGALAAYPIGLDAERVYPEEESARRS